MSKKPKQPIAYLDECVAFITKYVDDPNTHVHTAIDRFKERVDALIPEGGRSSVDRSQPDTSKETLIELVAINILLHRVYTNFLGKNYNNDMRHILHASYAMFVKFLIYDIEKVQITTCPMEHAYLLITNRLEIEDTEPLVHENDVDISCFISRYLNANHKGLVQIFGIVFTPNEAVDFIIRSCDDSTRVEYGKSLSDKGVNIIDPFAGAGIFIVRLLKLGVISDVDLEYKYHNEITGHEVVLLSFYIAVIFITRTYQEITGKIDTFQGMRLVDTFQEFEYENRDRTLTIKNNKPVVKKLPKKQVSTFGF